MPSLLQANDVGLHLLLHPVTINQSIYDEFARKSYSLCQCWLLVNSESRKTNLNVRGFGEYIHLEENKQYASKP
jgi:hypothetical protein